MNTKSKKTEANSPSEPYQKHQAADATEDYEEQTRFDHQAENTDRQEKFDERGNELRHSDEVLLHNFPEIQNGNLAPNGENNFTDRMERDEGNEVSRSPIAREGFLVADEDLEIEGSPARVQTAAQIAARRLLDGRPASTYRHQSVFNALHDKIGTKSRQRTISGTRR